MLLLVLLPGRLKQGSEDTGGCASGRPVWECVNNHPVIPCVTDLYAEPQQ